VTYERIKLIKPQRYDEMLADLRKRTGLNIKQFEARDIDFRRDTADVKIYYDEWQEPHENGDWNSEAAEGDSLNQHSL
jgi:hypothetical protein